MLHIFTAIEADFLRKNVNGRSQKEMAELFNQHFGMDLKHTQVIAYLKNHRLSNGLNSRFKPGQVPFNKGKMGIGGWKPTQFKSGNRPHNYKPVGTERVNGDGYVDIKIADPKKWKGKHILTWEEHHGGVPKGYVVIFGDGNHRNFDIDNLILVSRSQLGTLNKKGLIQKDAQSTRSAIIMVDIYHKINERKKQMHTP